MKEERIDSVFNLTFWAHVLVMFLAWTGPFLVYWPIMVSAYIIIQLQFFVFDRCLMNRAHGLNDEGDGYYTFYAYLLEKAGFKPDRKKLKFLARKVFNYCLITMTLIWQVGLGIEPLFVNIYNFFF